MARKAGLVAVLLLACFAFGDAQHSAITVLGLRVDPEARLNPQRVPLNFHVPGGDRQTASIEAWVRALPGQQIQVAARLEGLNGPNGAVAADALRWSGSKAGASAGGQAASCSSGTFQTAAAGDLVAGWRRSGILTCNVTFELATSNLAPGEYSGAVDLALDIR